jgi:hypothetical protein
MATPQTFIAASLAMTEMTDNRLNLAGTPEAGLTTASDGTVYLDTILEEMAVTTLDEDPEAAVAHHTILTGVAELLWEIGGLERDEEGIIEIESDTDIGLGRTLYLHRPEIAEDGDTTTHTLQLREYRELTDGHFMADGRSWRFVLGNDPKETPRVFIPEMKIEHFGLAVRQAEHSILDKQEDPRNQISREITATTTDPMWRILAIIRATRGQGDINEIAFLLELAAWFTRMDAEALAAGFTLHDMRTTKSPDRTLDEELCRYQVGFDAEGPLIMAAGILQEKIIIRGDRTELRANLHAEGDELVLSWDRTTGVSLRHSRHPASPAARLQGFARLFGDVRKQIVAELEEFDDWQEDQQRTEIALRDPAYSATWARPPEDTTAPGEAEILWD